LDDLELKTIDIPGTRSAYVANKLREAILNGKFAPGVKLAQDKIAESLNVSRSPVREAVHILAAEGLIQIIPHHGAIVAELSTEELQEIYSIRIILEGMAARLAVPNMTDMNIKELESILNVLRNTKKTETWIRYNQQFHNTIYMIANRRRLLSIIENLRMTCSSYIRYYIGTAEFRAKACIEHERLYDACKAHDGDRAEHEIKVHLKSVLDGVLTNMESTQD
jgi:DNA-binding GntR family transcriptional regulator